jgi:hypothetical protein
MTDAPADLIRRVERHSRAVSGSVPDVRRPVTGEWTWSEDGEPRGVRPDGADSPRCLSGAVSIWRRRPVSTRAGQVARVRVVAMNGPSGGVKSPQRLLMSRRCLGSPVNTDSQARRRCRPRDGADRAKRGARLHSRSGSRPPGSRGGSPLQTPCGMPRLLDGHPGDVPGAIAV